MKSLIKKIRRNKSLNGLRYKTLKYSTMKKLLLAVIMTVGFLMPFSNLAQENSEPLCGTRDATFRSDGNNESNLSKSSKQENESYRGLSISTIPINFTIIRKEDCIEDRAKITVEILKKALLDINAYFPFGKDFKVAKVQYIIDPAMATLPDATNSDPKFPTPMSADKALYDKYAFKNGAIEVFIVTTQFSYAWLPENIGWDPKVPYVPNFNFIALSSLYVYLYLYFYIYLSLSFSLSLFYLSLYL